MEYVNLREFANMSSLEMIVFCEERREVTVIDDLKETILTDTLLLGLTWFGLITHRHFNDEPYMVDEVITLTGEGGYPTFIDDKLLTKPLNSFQGRIMLKHNSPEFYDRIKQYNFVHQNMLHNYLSIIGQEGVVSARAVDVLTIIDHPTVQQIKADRRARKITPEEAMKRFDKILITDPAFDKSVFGLLYRTKALDKIQSYQMVVERGVVFDIDNTILPFTIDDSYADGIVNRADSLGDSKGAGFSLISNGRALQDAEWFHMKIHNLANVVISVGYQKDCGSTKGVIVNVISKEFRHNLQGKFYFKPDGSIELIHMGNIEQIEIGSTIKLRSVAWCHHGSTGRPCSVCFGRMDSVIPYNPYTKRSSVPGLFFGSVFGEKTGQAILKTKHTIGSAKTVPFTVQENDEDYIETDEDGDYIYFTDEFLKEKKDPYIVIGEDMVAALVDYDEMESLDELIIGQIPVTEKISIMVTDVSPMFDDEVAVSFKSLQTSIGSRRARMTREFIEFLLTKEQEAYGRRFAKKSVKISLLGWKSHVPAYELTIINEGMDAYRHRVEMFMKFGHLKADADVPVTEQFHGEQMIEFWKVVHEKNKEANIIIHDIFLWVCMAKAPMNLDFSLPNADDERYLMAMTKCFKNRGQCNAMMFGYQSGQLASSPLNFLIKNRQRGVMESFLTPLTIY